jgi:tetratricopeptide (TPR) repeat protein
LRARDWKRSVSDFEKILARDSLFKDVLYQYATLHRYKGDFDPALRLLHRQVALKPELAHVRLSLFRTYRQLLHENDPVDVAARLEAHPSAQATFFKGVLLRRNGQHLEADAVLTHLMENRNGILYQPILLERARIYYAMERPRIAQSFVRQAIRAIENEVDARFVL